MIVVADASPLIAVARIGRLDLLRSVFGQLLVPDAVWREVVVSWINCIDRPASGFPQSCGNC